jgi:hypothetical protein
MPSNKNMSVEGLATVAHTCNPSYLEGRYQESQSSRPAGQKS